MFYENLRKIDIYLNNIINDYQMKNLINLKNKKSYEGVCPDELIVENLITQIRMVHEYYFKIRCSKEKINKILICIDLSKSVEKSCELELFVHGKKENFYCIQQLYNIITLIREMLENYIMFGEKAFNEHWDKFYCKKFIELGVPSLKMVRGV